MAYAFTRASCIPGDVDQHLRSLFPGAKLHWGIPNGCLDGRESLHRVTNYRFPVHPSAGLVVSTDFCKLIVEYVSFNNASEVIRHDKRSSASERSEH